MVLYVSCLIACCRTLPGLMVALVLVPAHRYASNAVRIEAEGEIMGAIEQWVAQHTLGGWCAAAAAAEMHACVAAGHALHLCTQ